MKWSEHLLDGVQEAFGQCSQGQGVTLGDVPAQGQELGRNDPGGSLPAQHILFSVIL